MLLREFDERLKLTAGLKELVVDERDRRYIEHPALNLLRQRIYQIAAGYEDANDATFLRHDRLCARWRAGVKCRWLPTRLCGGWKMRSPGNRSALWSAWARRVVHPLWGAKAARTGNDFGHLPSGLMIRQMEVPLANSTS